MAGRRMSERCRGRRSREEIEDLVLKLVLRANRPPSAYDLSASAAAAGVSLVPNQVYRTLARLIETGLVVRIETLNAYVPRQHDNGANLVCLGCRSVESIPAGRLDSSLCKAASGVGFALQTGTIEARGLCRDCSDSSAA